MRIDIPFTSGRQVRLTNSNYPKQNRRQDWTSKIYYNYIYNISINQGVQ